MERPEFLPTCYTVPKALKKDKPLPWIPINGALNPTVPLAVVFTQLLKLIQYEAHSMWNQLARSYIGLNISQCQIVTGCDDVAKYIEWINGLIARVFRDIHRLKLRTSDFGNMYTNLPQREMVEKLSELLTYVRLRSSRETPKYD